MSKANNPIKVLRTALKRVDKGWTKGDWHQVEDDGKGGTVHTVCLEGAIYGYCDSNKHQVTDAQRTAIKTVEQILGERRGGNTSIPGFNDDQFTTKDDVKEVIKLAIIRLETSDGLDDDDLDDLIEFKSKKEASK